MGRMRFSSRWNWVPKILVNQPLYINPLFVIQPVRRDVVADGIGHQIADGAAPPHPLPDHRGRHIHRRHLDDPTDGRSEEHTSELQSLAYLVCRLLLEKKKNTAKQYNHSIRHNKAVRVARQHTPIS